MTDQPTGRDLIADLARVLNQHCAENGSNTPDFILANYMLDCLCAFERSTRAREKWLGRSLSIGGGEMAHGE